MATQATYAGIIPRTQIPTAVALVIGVRVTVDSSGTVALSAIGVRGDFTTLVAAAASEPVNVASMQGGGRVPALASEATTVGAAAYSAASGKYSASSGGGAILVGKWVEAASGDGILGAVELSNPA